MKFFSGNAQATLSAFYFFHVTSLASAMSSLWQLSQTPPYSTPYAPESLSHSSSHSEQKTSPHPITFPQNMQIRNIFHLLKNFTESSFGFGVKDFFVSSLTPVINNNYCASFAMSASKTIFHLISPRLTFK